MGTEIANLPPTIQRYGQSLEPQARLKHRLWIGLRVEALLDGYWQSRPDEAVKAEIMADWIDGLETYTPDEIRTACRSWLRDNPRRKPNVGDIANAIDAVRGRVLAAYRASQPKPQPQQVQPSFEERRAAAQRIMEQVWKRS